MPDEALMTLPPELLLQCVAGAEGCGDVAWLRGDAMSVVSFLSGSAVAVLGGDVLRRGSDLTVHTYDNWHSDRREAESWPVYVARSHQETEAYLRNYPDPEDGTIVYVLVLRVGA